MFLLHDWRVGDRVASIAVRESVGKTGLGTIQRILLEKAVIVWDDGYQSEERLKDLILAGFNSSKVLESETLSMTGNITTELKNPKERTNVNAKLISGLPLTLEDGIEWGI
jgi:hypothetical protein|tara:strand:+ start:294 stop:626 length:333 start_codon:yes stop_codon:yes gene_type:complete